MWKYINFSLDLQNYWLLKTLTVLGVTLKDKDGHKVFFRCHSSTRGLSRLRDHLPTYRVGKVLSIYPLHETGGRSRGHTEVLLRVASPHLEIRGTRVRWRLVPSFPVYTEYRSQGVWCSKDTVSMVNDKGVLESHKEWKSLSNL